MFESLESRTLLSSYVVSTSGNDGNDGSASSPWRTLQHAVDTVQGGDTVTILAGSYTGFEMGNSGSAGARIVFSASGNVVINQEGNGSDGINLEGASFVTIEGFTINGMARAGIRSVINQGVIIRNNSCDNNGFWGIFTGFSENVVIEGNTTSRSHEEHGIYVSNSADNPTVRNNHSWGNFSAGIQLNADISQGGDGIITGALIERNILHDNGVGNRSATINLDGVQNSRIQNNLIYDNTNRNGIALFAIDGAQGSRNNLVVNNTILVNEGASLHVQDGSSNNTFLNNILLGGDGTYDVSDNSTSGMQTDHNVVTDRFGSQDADSIIGASLADLFVNVAQDDYHLRDGSPAIEIGQVLNAPAVDLDGNDRIARPDAGAYESGGTPGPGTPPPEPLTAALSFKSDFLSRLLAAKPAPMTLEMTNVSDDLLNGAFSARIVISTDATFDESDPTVATVSGKRLRIAASKIGKLTLNSLLPIDIAEGSYFFAAQITATDPVSGQPITTVTPISSQATFIPAARTGYTDADGSIVTITYRGGTGGAVYNSVTGLVDLIFSGTDGATSINVNVRGGTDMVTTFGDVLIDGSAKSLNATKTDVLNDINVTGSLRSLAIRNIADQHTITIGASAGAVTMKMAAVTDLSINSAAPIQMLSVTGSWLDLDATPDVITAPSLDVLSVRGDFGAGLNLSGIGLLPNRTTLKSAKIGGAIGPDTWDIVGNAGTISAGSITSGWTANISGSLASITVKFDASGTIDAAEVKKRKVGGVDQLVIV